jgi:gamma-glutamyltranspeptidase/glutathione hydrolase
MNIQAALEQARFTKGTFDGCDVQMEETVSVAVREQLTARGHDIKLLGPLNSAVGQGDAVMRDTKRNVNFGAGDPRCDGSAIPQGPNTK